MVVKYIKKKINFTFNDIRQSKNLKSHTTIGNYILNLSSLTIAAVLVTTFMLQPTQSFSKSFLCKMQRKSLLETWKSQPNNVTKSTKHCALLTFYHFVHQEHKLWTSFHLFTCQNSSKMQLKNNLLGGTV